MLGAGGTFVPADVGSLQALGPPDETTEITTADAPPVELPTEEETDPPVDEPPTVSLDQLSFTPASPEGQVLTEKGHSP